MNTRTEQHGNTEIGIIEYEGKEFAAFGSVITDTHISAYLGKAGVLTNWAGEAVGTYHITSTWSIPRSFVSSTMHQVYACVNGKTYTGRSAGVGMLFNGKLVRK